MRTGADKPKFENEQALVASFCEWAKRQGWVPYSETAGWDLVLVRPTDGFQVGIEAKMSLNPKVLCQVMEHDRYSNGHGPDCHAVLVPSVGLQQYMATLARRLCVVVITASTRRHWTKESVSFDPALPGSQFLSRDEYAAHGGWPERCPDRRLQLPDYVPDVTGGASAPIRLTDWKIRALRAAVVLEIYGNITRAEFKALGLDHRRWTDHWLQPNGDGSWSPRAMPNFRAQHPANYEQIKADRETWMKTLPARLPL